MREAPRIARISLDALLGMAPSLHLLMDNCHTSQNTSGTTGFTTAGGQQEIFP
jgi:hypothetical protein